MKCPNCGKELPEASTVCTHCGAVAGQPLTPEERARRRWQEREQQRREKKKQKKKSPENAAALTPEDIFKTVAKTAQHTAPKAATPINISIEEVPTDNPMADVIQTLVKELDDDRRSHDSHAPSAAASLLHTPTEQELPDKSMPVPSVSEPPDTPMESADASQADHAPEAAAEPEAIAEKTDAASEEEEPEPPKAVQAPTPAPSDKETSVSSHAPHSVVHRSLPSEKALEPKAPEVTAKKNSSPEPTRSPEPVHSPETEDDDLAFQPIRLADALRLSPSAPAAENAQQADEPVSTTDTPAAPRSNKEPSAPAVSAETTVLSSKPAPHAKPLASVALTQDTVIAAPPKPAEDTATAEPAAPTHSTSAHGTMRFNVADALASMPEQNDTAIPDIRIPEAYARVRYVPQDSPQWAQEAAQDEENDWEGFDPEDAGWMEEEETPHPLRLIFVCIVLAVMAALAVYSVATSGMI